MLTYCIICGLYDGLLNKTFSNEVRNILKKRQENVVMVFGLGDIGFKLN